MLERMEHAGIEVEALGAATEFGTVEGGWVER